MPLYNLLTENLISVRYENGAKDKLTLPGVLAKLSREDIESFNALQPHQEQAWYCFSCNWRQWRCMKVKRNQ